MHLEPYYPGWKDVKDDTDPIPESEEIKARAQVPEQLALEWIRLHGVESCLVEGAKRERIQAEAEGHQATRVLPQARHQRR